MSEETKEAVEAETEVVENANDDIIANLQKENKQLKEKLVETTEEAVRRRKTVEKLRQDVDKLTAKAEVEPSSKMKKS